MLKAQEKAIAAFAKKAAKADRGAVLTTDDGYFITDRYTVVTTTAKLTDITLSDDDGRWTPGRLTNILDDLRGGRFYEIECGQSLQPDLALLEKKQGKKPVVLKSDGGYNLSTPIIEAFDGVKIQQILKMVGKDPLVTIGGEFFKQYGKCPNGHSILRVESKDYDVEAFLMPLRDIDGAKPLPLSSEEREEIKVSKQERKDARETPIITFAKQAKKHGTTYIAGCVINDGDCNIVTDGSTMVVVQGDLNLTELPVCEDERDVACYGNLHASFETSMKYPISNSDSLLEDLRLLKSVEHKTVMPAVLQYSKEDAKPRYGIFDVFRIITALRMAGKNPTLTIREYGNHGQVFAAESEDKKIKVFLVGMRNIAGRKADLLPLSPERREELKMKKEEMKKVKA